MKRDYIRLFGLLGAAVLALGSLAPLRAQDSDQDDLRRGVARISLINGDVSVRRGDTGEWVAAAINAPLMTEDRVATGPNSRVEIQFDAANFLRAGGNAEVRMANLEYGKYQIEVAHGTVDFSVLRPSTDNVEVDTPSVSVRPSKQGVYRIAVSEGGETQVTARAGEVEVFTPHGSQWVNSGQMLMARGAVADAEFQLVAANPLDDWDRWNQERDRAMTQTTSYQYVPQGVYGVEDLDSYGTWANTDEYGWAWRPRYVGADWSPYSQGRWAWEDWYGWTWVSYDPWGWAPYHYGRWFHEARYGWCWYPGAFGGGRHYWSPALVAFFGYGSGVGVGFGFGHVGWVPLAPHEGFNRWWGRSYYHNGNNFNRNINITNVNITNNYRNARVRNGISGVAEGDFRGGRFNQVSHVSGDQVRQAGLIRGQVPITPNNANLRFSDRTVSHTPRSNDNVKFFARQQPNRAERVPFAQQQRAMEAGNRSVEQAGRGGQRNESAAPAAGFRQQQQQQQPGVTANPQGRSSGGWQRFGQTPNAGNTQNTTPRGQSNGWRGAGSPAVQQNTRPQAQGGSSPSQAAPSRGSWTRFGEPGNRPQANQSPRQQSESPRSFSPRNDQQLRTSPPVVRERPQYSSPQRSTPQSQPRSFGRPSYSAPSSPRSYSAPSSRSYSAPQPRASSPAPSYSAPRGGGGGMSAPRQSGGGGGGSAPRGNSGGGGGHASSGGRGGGRR